MSEKVLMMDCGDGQRRANNGGNQPPEAKTAAYTILHGDAGKIFTNTGAGGSVTFTLPATSTALNGPRITGLRFLICKVTNQNVVIQAPTGATINGGSSAGAFQNVTSSASAVPTCEIIAISETAWIARPTIGTWANNP